MATIDVTSGNSAQPYTGHSPVSVLDFSYSAVTHPAASGDDVLMLDLPTNAIVLGGYVTITTAETAADTGDFGLLANGTELASNFALNATGTTNFTVAAPLLVAAGGGLWLNADAALAQVVLNGKLIVVYTNL